MFGIIIFLSVAIWVMPQTKKVQHQNKQSQDPTLQQLKTTQRALSNLQQMLGPVGPEFEYQDAVVDTDGNVYQTVKIGDRIWMTSNLNVTHYQNGDLIDNIKDSETWSRLSTGAWCYYNNDTINEKQNGKLYNFYAVSDNRNIAPKGWHVATNAEWRVLKNYLAGTKAKSDDGSTNLIQILDEDNKMGFKSGAGMRYKDFIGGEVACSFWTSDIGNNIAEAKFCMFRYIANNDIILTSNDRQESAKQDGSSVRCVKNIIIMKSKLTTKTKKR